MYRPSLPNGPMGYFTNYGPELEAFRKNATLWVGEALAGRETLAVAQKYYEEGANA